VRAAEDAETALAEEAVLMAEVLGDVVLATTFATADADNSRQKTTIKDNFLCVHFDSFVSPGIASKTRGNR